jgi:hypothetical protein
MTSTFGELSSCSEDHPSSLPASLLLLLLLLPPEPPSPDLLESSPEVDPSGDATTFSRFSSSFS